LATQKKAAEEKEAKKKKAQEAILQARRESEQKENEKYFNRIREIYKDILTEEKDEKTANREASLFLFCSLSLIFPVFLPVVAFSLMQMGVEKAFPETSEKVMKGAAFRKLKDDLKISSETLSNTVSRALGLDDKDRVFSSNLHRILDGGNPLNFPEDLLKIIKEKIPKEDLNKKHTEAQKAAPATIQSVSSEPSNSPSSASATPVNGERYAVLDQDGIGGNFT
jgi:hypothetical protein